MIIVVYSESSGNTIQVTRNYMSSCSTTPIYARRTAWWTKWC